MLKILKILNTIDVVVIMAYLCFILVIHQELAATATEQLNSALSVIGW